MNTNPNAKTVLCFGDSNTWGQKPDKSNRYPAGIRWTGQLQNMLGDHFYVIEEGLGGRVTNFDPDDRNDRNGYTYLLQAAPSHNPIDYFVIMLGTNDMKYRFNRSALDITDAIKELVDFVAQGAKSSSGGKTQIIVVSPAYIDHTAAWFTDMYANDFDETSTQKSIELYEKLVAVAKEHNWLCINGADYAEVGDDGLHLNEKSNKTLASAIFEAIDV